MLLPNENIIHQSECIYNSPDGGTFLCNLTITNIRVIIKPGKNMDFKTMAFSPLLFTVIDGIAVINKSDISAIATSNISMCHKCIITLTDNSQHVFDKRILSVTKIAESIAANTNLLITASEKEPLQVNNNNYTTGLFQCPILFALGFFCWFKTMNIYSFDTIWDYIWVGFKYICFGGILIISAISLVGIANNYPAIKSRSVNQAIIVYSIFFLLMLSGLIDEIILFTR